MQILTGLLRRRNCKLESDPITTPANPPAAKPEAPSLAPYHKVYLSYPFYFMGRSPLVAY
jgi:hypothetical protein